MHILAHQSLGYFFNPRIKDVSKILHIIVHYGYNEQCSFISIFLFILMCNTFT